MLDLPASLQQILAGRYVVKREIGRGGAATVYLAHDVRHERLVAIKLLHPELSHALGAQRFLREIKLTASLQHPHILPIHDSGELADQLFYVMPYVEGESLRQKLGADNRLSIEEAVRIGREVAGALAYAHERGVIHRDIKPENILFSGGHAVLADFGIARAINRANEKITQQGMITGTPAYMSPEQARDRAFDGRSDVYSLGCVMYEAISGVPVFSGNTPQELLAARVAKPAPLLREYRHDVPAAIEAVIAKALSISPDDRYDDARSFSAALSAAIGNSGETVSTRPVRRPAARNPWLWAAGVTLLVAGGAATSPGGRDRIDLLAGRVDSAQYAVMPFQYVGAPTPAEDQEPVAQGLYAALRDWRGLKLVSDISVLDAMHHSNDPSLSGLLAISRRVRAGRLVWGRVWLTADSLRVRAGVYDAITGESVRELTLAGSRRQLDAQPDRWRALAIDLLRKGGERREDDGDAATHSFPAWQAYQEGIQELSTWNLPAATADFERATVDDPAFPQPRLWLAQLLVWRGAPATAWTPHVSAALRGRGSLGARTALLASALAATQREDLASACESYDAMRQRDSLDAVAWMGLVQCMGNDTRVVRSASSPSGWAFRSSYSAAQAAYGRALQIAPPAFGAFPFEFLRRLYIVEPSVMRQGRAADSSAFFAMPDVRGDTVAFVPWPMQALSSMPFEKAAPQYTVALARNRAALLALLGTLTQRLPDNADAFEALARVLETRDEITGTPNGGHSALSALERAKQLSRDTGQLVRLGAADIRLHLKLGDFSRATAVGDSILLAMPQVTGTASIQLAGIAALLGRESRAVGYIRASGQSVSPTGGAAPPLLEEVGAALLVRASLGVCDDSLRALRRRVDTLLESYVGSGDRPRVRDLLLARPITAGLSCFGPRAALALAPSPIPIVAVEQMLGRGDLPGARARLDSLERGRRMFRPGEYALDYTVAEAWMRAALGDSVAAERQLDLTLTALPTLSPHVVYEPGMSAAVGRSMVLRAQLAAARHDGGTAALWAGRVLTLWAHADPSLSPTLSRMRSLAAHRP